MTITCTNTVISTITVTVYAQARINLFNDEVHSVFKSQNISLISQQLSKAPGELQIYY